MLHVLLLWPLLLLLLLLILGRYKLLLGGAIGRGWFGELAKVRLVGNSHILAIFHGWCRQYSLWRYSIFCTIWRPCRYFAIQSLRWDGMVDAYKRSRIRWYVKFSIYWEWSVTSAKQSIQKCCWYVRQHCSHQDELWFFNIFMILRSVVKVWFPFQSLLLYGMAAC